MKTVCIVVQNYYDIDIRVRRKAEALVSAGYAVDVLALRAAREGQSSYILSGVQVHTISLGKQRGSLGRYVFEYLAFLVWAAVKMIRLNKRRQYAVVDTNNLPDFLVFAAFWPKLKGAKVVFDMHEITPEFFMSKYQVDDRHWLVRLARAIEKVSMRYADHVITINQPIQQLLASRGLPPGKCTVIMNAVDEELFRTGPETLPVDPSDGKATFVMMYHGTLTRIYGLDIALEAFGQVHQEMPGAEFWILGKGPEEKALREQARRLGLESKVRFIGSVLPHEIPAWLRRCHVGVLPTRQDVFLDLSFSNKLSEYIIMDKPVIASGIRTIRYYFSSGALAFFEPEKPADLAKQMLILRRDAELRNRFARQARQEYQPICWHVMRQRYLDLMTRLTNPAESEPQLSDRNAPAELVTLVNRPAPSETAPTSSCPHE
jgi:glycosyltransferase involved in cell wall biosynthesis